MTNKMTNKERISKVLVITAQLQLMVENLEEIEEYITPFNAGNLKKRCTFLKKEIDNYLNFVYKVDEEGQKQIFSVIKELETTFREGKHKILNGIEIL
jgi:hypothetical protein